MKKSFIYLITILGFFIIGILIANLVIMPYIVQKGKTVSVPNVCNLPLEDAIEELKTQNLEGVVTERRYDQIIEEGCVIVQNPLPDTKGEDWQNNKSCCEYGNGDHKSTIPSRGGH